MLSPAKVFRKQGPGEMMEGSRGLCGLPTAAQLLRAESRGTGPPSSPTTRKPPAGFCSFNEFGVNGAKFWRHWRVYFIIAIIIIITIINGYFGVVGFFFNCYCFVTFFKQGFTFTF